MRNKPASGGLGVAGNHDRRLTANLTRRSGAAWLIQPIADAQILLRLGEERFAPDAVDIGGRSAAWAGCGLSAAQGRTTTLRVFIR